LGYSPALTWGAGDFGGGLASRRAGFYRAAFYGEFIGLFFLAIMLGIVQEPLPAGPVWAWSVSAGAFGAVGLLLLYRSLAEGQMRRRRTCLRPDGSRPARDSQQPDRGTTRLTKYLGFALALVAIWLISQGEGHQKQLHLHLADLRLPLLAGVCFGVYFILIHQGSRDPPSGQ